MESSESASKRAGEEGVSHSSSLSYLRGFYAAERRRNPVNEADELSPGAAMVRHTVHMAPLALLWVGWLWMSARMRYGPSRASLEWAAWRRGGGAPAGGKGDGEKSKTPTFMEELKVVFQNAMTPLAPRNFRVHVKGTSFKDVIGVPEAVQQVEQYVQFLKAPEKFTRLGGRLPKGCLLTGPPGTGKTLLAKAVAGEANVPFFSCNGSDFLELYAGSGPKRVRELFAAAKAEVPSVVFIDELDAVGARNGSGAGSSISSEENRTINQLLSELDGLERSDSIIVFAATNYKENIDKALLRDGRFDRKVELELPDLQGRTSLFLHYLKRIKLEGEMFIKKDAASAPQEQQKTTNNEEDNVLHTEAALKLATKLASLTPGISPATVSTIVNEAAVQAGVQGCTVVPVDYLFPAIDDVLLGKRQSARSRLSDKAAIRSAWHESGHALVAWLLSPLQPDVLKVSIVSRNLHHDSGNGGEENQGGRVGGYTQQMGKEALEMTTELSLFSDVCVLVAGRYGELLMTEGAELDEVSTGAQDDFQKATQKALENFLSYGMAHAETSALGLLSYEPQRIREGRIFQKHSSSAQSLAEREAGRFVAAASTFVHSLLLEHRAELRQLAEALARTRELDRDALESTLGHLRPGWSTAEGAEQQTTTPDGATREGRLEIARSRAKEALSSFFKASEEAALQRVTQRDSFLGNPA